MRGAAMVPKLATVGVTVGVLLIALVFVRFVPLELPAWAPLAGLAALVLIAIASYEFFERYFAPR